MSALEQLVCPFDRWTQEYETTYSSTEEAALELSPSNRDQISTLELLCCYSRVLNFYMDLTCEDAISILNELDKLPLPEQANGIEKQLIGRLETMKQDFTFMSDVGIL